MYSKWYYLRAAIIMVFGAIGMVTTLFWLFNLNTHLQGQQILSFLVGSVCGIVWFIIGYSTLVD